MQRTRCTNVTVIPRSIALAVALVGNVLEDAEFIQDGHCWLEEHHDLDHRALVAEGVSGNDVWVSWADNRLPRVIMVLTPCVVSSPGNRDGCTLFNGHPARHSWEFVDPEYEAVRSYIETSLGGFRELASALSDGTAVLWPMN